MSTSLTRRFALQVLYQFDAGNTDLESVQESLHESGGNEKMHREAVRLAQKAWESREQADAAVATLTEDWPTHRQPVVDRSLLRLAYYEMVVAGHPFKVVINEAVEIAREYSTEKSPLFINGVLDKLWRGVAGSTVTPVENEVEVEIDVTPDTPSAEPDPSSSAAEAG